MLDTIKEMPTPKILTFCFSMKEFKGEVGASQKQWPRLTAAIFTGIVGLPEISAHRILILAAH